MLIDYRLGNIRIEKIAEGKQNAGKYFVVGKLRNLKNRWAHQHTIVIFEEDMPDWVAQVRAAFPTSKGGTNTAIDTATFDPIQAQRQLENVDGEDLTLFPGGKFILVPLPGRYVRRYSTNLGGHKKDELVMEGSGKYVDVIEELGVFTMMVDEAANQYAEGWEPKARLKSQMRTLIPLEALIGTEDEKYINPRYLPGAEKRIPTDGEEAAIDDK